MKILAAAPSTHLTSQPQSRFSFIRKFLRQFEKLIRKDIFPLLLTLAGLITFLKLLCDQLTKLLPP